MSRNQAGSTDSPGTCYTFGVFRLEADGRLYRGETSFVLPQLELKALQILLTNTGHVVSPARMREALWGDRRAGAAALAECIASLRERLAPHAGIEAVYKRGYRLTVEAHPQDHHPNTSLPRLVIMPLSVSRGVTDYLGHAIAEETNAHLSRARHPVATVVAQDSVHILAARGNSPRQIGSMLNADLVLTGTIHALPSHFRLEVQMISAGDDCQLWAEDLLIERSRLAGVEKELADRITYRLQRSGLSIVTEVAPTERDAEPWRREAWETYQQARQEWRSLERHHMQDALQHLSGAIELDPMLIGARVELAHLCISQTILGFMQPANAASIIKRAAVPDLSLPIIPEAMQPALGWIRFHVDRNLASALHSFSISAHLPHDRGVTLARSTFALSRHRTQEAVGILRSAIQLDPWSPWLHGRLIWALHLVGDADESLTQAEEAMERFPEHLPAAIYGALVLAYCGDPIRATEISREMTKRSPYSDLATAIYAYALARAGQEAEARIHLDRLRWLSQERYVLPSLMASVHVALGENAAAVEQLRLADGVRCPWFFQMLADPRLKPLHGQPEFAALQQILPAMEAAAEQDEVLN